MPKRKNIILAGLVFILLVTFFSYVKYHRYNQGLSIVISSDAEGYYQYLTALFIKHDILNQPYGYPLPDGKIFNKYNYGVALLEMPFFLIAHGVTKLFGLPINGKFTAYSFALIIGTAFYVFIGLLLLFRLLLKIYSKRASMITLVILFFGTNLLYYTYLEPGMSHAYAFFLIAVWIYSIDQFYINSDWKGILTMSVTLGIIALIRIPHVLVLLYLPFYKVNRICILKDRVKFLLNHWKFLLLLPLIILIFYIPQILYWHAITGHYIVNPYDYSYAEEGFTFITNPHFFQVLFSPVGGWITVTPLVLLGIYGLLSGFEKNEISPWGTLLMILIPLYVYASWWHPNIDASYGHRGMVDILPFLALPIGGVIQKLNYEKWLLRNIAFGLIFLFIFINIRLSYLYTYMWWNVEWGWTQYFDQMLKTVFIGV